MPGWHGGREFRRIQTSPSSTTTARSIIIYFTRVIPLHRHSSSTTTRHLSTSPRTMSTLRPLNPSLVSSLNALLAARFVLVHPTDLTPSLLLAIFVGELLCWPYSNHHSYGTEEGDTTNFSSSLLRPSPKTSRSPRPPSPSPSVDVDADADFSALSHITDVLRHPLVHPPSSCLPRQAQTSPSTHAASPRAPACPPRTTIQTSSMKRHKTRCRCTPR
ncbi:hypothetical protein OG21DRAFT_211889 [Imleria badia]|nr:hypothetical protein OG21DRAFT_211889 [Imleria badia]